MSTRAKDVSGLEHEVASLYQSAEKIYPREIKGRFQTLRAIAVWVLLGLYYVLPWINWGGRQIVLFDLPERKFYVFGMVFWPQDFILLTGLLIIAALTLFFFTALAGRLWCGYACPQTVWTEAFIWLERLAEGPAIKRKKRDRGPMTREKLARKTFKQFLWITFAFWTGLTFVGYFSPIRELGPALVSFNLGFWETFWIAFYGLATYGNAGFLREQVCKYMCPYARFQSAMFDRDTMVISYDDSRGEPRGPRSRKVDPAEKGLGDCIDCTLCVQVCPTGIDIREGLQYECIGCAACIDACDSVMDKMGYPRGLVRYTTQRSLEGEPTRVLRPRIFIYATLLLALVGLWGYGVFARPDVTLDVMRDRNALFRTASSGAIENAYTIRVINRTETAHNYRLQVEGIDGIRLVNEATIELGPGVVGSLPATVAVPPEHAAGGHQIRFSLVATDAPDLSAEERARFIGPVR